MERQICGICESLLRPNGPEDAFFTPTVSPTTGNTTTAASSNAVLMNEERLSPTTLNHEHGTMVDSHSKDPRWVDLFVQYFIHPSPYHLHMDDLLFFVRDQQSPGSTNYSASTLSSDGPIFVKRKTKDNRVPELNEIVQWKETFFLNLLIQMPFEMCVSVCQKPLSVEQLAPYSPSAPIASRRMLVRKTVSKPVFANPNRSRMDKKSSKNEITYPTLYFCVNDFEDVFEDVIVRETEYLCVELSMMIPMSAAVATAAKPTTSGDGNDYEDGTGGYDTDATNATTTTLPAQLPSEVVRVTLFQGAVPFSALLDVFQSKYKENPLVKSFQRLSRSLGGHSTDETTQDTHYITMRGPGGKGHAQVAIRPVNPASNAVSSVNSRLPSPERSSNSNNVLQGLTVALKRSILTPWRLPDAEQLNEHGMHCHMTYIHLNWQSIIRDLLQEFHDYHKDAAAFINSTTTTTQTPSQ